LRWAHKEGLCRIVLARLERAKDVLDYGCGDGWYAARFVVAGLRTCGVDKSARAIGFASRIVPEGRFEVADGSAIPFPDSSFDAVTCIQVFEHMTEEAIAAALREIARVLRPGGKLIVSVPSTNRPMSKAHLRHYTVASLEAGLSGFGCISEIVGHEARNRWSLRARKVFDNRFWLCRLPARFFYDRFYLRRLNEVSPSSAMNLVAVLVKAPAI